jgi:selenocysteine lyase/cysteine desulfurase
MFNPCHVVFFISYLTPMNKRTFLKSSLAWAATGLMPFDALAQWVQKYEHESAQTLASNEEFWEGVRQEYRLKPDYINLENGYYNFIPQKTLERYVEHVREVNYQGSYYMRTVQTENKRKIAAQLAALAGCLPEELIITRNTTESLDTIIGGFDWKAGDEAVMAQQDYGAMLDMFKQVAKRHGVVNRVISLPNLPDSDDEIVNLYAQAITSKTRLLMVCHMVNITGQILPVRKICDMAHRKGVQVLVDGAHAFAHIQYKIAELNCDYYGTSLHKWLSVPLGAGFLYVRKEHVNRIWPLLADQENETTLARLNHTGTHPVHTDLTIADAIDFYQTLGPARKEERLRYLQTYWSSRVRSLPRIRLNTPAETTRACGIANVGVEGIKPSVLAETLLKQYKIFTVAIDGAGVHGCRITPNVYTSTQELDVFVSALKEISSH